MRSGNDASQYTERSTTCDFLLVFVPDWKLPLPLASSYYCHQQISLSSTLFTPFTFKVAGIPHGFADLPAPQLLRLTPGHGRIVQSKYAKDEHR